MTECLTAVKELKRLSPGTVDCLTVLGYHVPGDGGGGLFWWDPECRDADNAGTIIASDPIPASGRWRRMVDGPLSIRWFGAKGAKDIASADNEDIVTTAAINTALSVAGPNNAVYIPPGIYVVSNIEIDAEQVLFGAGRDQSILRGKLGSAGKMLTNKSSGVKIILRDFCLDANCQDYTHIIDLGNDKAPFGTEGYLANLWLRDAPKAIGLNLYANVGYGYNITIQCTRELFHCAGNANIFSTIAVASCVDKSIPGCHSTDTPGPAVFLQGCDIHGLHIEAPESNSVPLYFSRESSVTGCSISLANNTTFDHLIEIDPSVSTWHLYHLTYLFGNEPKTVVVRKGNIKLGNGIYGGGNASGGSIDGQGSWTNAPPRVPFPTF
jgi:hypothetical protein